MEQILLAYGFPKETAEAIIILYKNTKVKVGSSDGDTVFFNNVADALQENTLTSYLFIICLDYVVRTNERKYLYTKKKTNPTQTITDADDADYIALLANKPTQTESFLHSLEYTAGSIGLHVNAYKTEYRIFNKNFTWWFPEMRRQVQIHW